MELNAGEHSKMSSWEALFRHHNLVADQIHSKPGNRAPLIGGMTWEVAISTRHMQQRYGENYYGETSAGLVANRQATGIV